MKTLRTESIAAKLHRGRITIQNTTRNAEIQAAVALYGYTSQKMIEGANLLSATQDKVNAATEAAGDQQLAGAFVEKCYKAVQGAYQDLAKVARAVFLRDEATLALLGLDQSMPRTEADFALAVDTLFNTGAYPDAVRTKLTAQGYTDAKLSLERSKIAEWKFAGEAYASTKGAAQQAVAVQTAALKTLVDWVMAYSKIARVALKGQPQLLEKLGLLVRNARTKAQREAPAKAAATRQAKATLAKLPRAA